MSKALKVMPVPSEGELDENASVVLVRSARMFGSYAIVQFWGKAMIRIEDQTQFGPFKHYVPLTKNLHDKLAYQVLGGLTKSQLNDMYGYVTLMAPDVTEFGHLFLLGDMVWDSRELRFREDVDPDLVIWRSPIAPTAPNAPIEFLLAAANDDQGVYEDMLQSMAPILMEQKPYGVFWWVGAGANGKSSLMEALYRIFPGQLASLTVKRLTDERDTPMLNGHLANVVKESSEGRIEDTQIYKSIGTHEDFSIHKFHSQDAMTIRGNMHHIFSANQIPVFNDKGLSVRRRTLIIPFKARFEADPTFEATTFTKETLGKLLSCILRTATHIRDQHYRYKFSIITEGAKADYDEGLNTAEEYARSLLDEGVVGFDNFEYVRPEYERWCAKNGYTPLGTTYMRRAIQAAGFERRSIRTDGAVVNKYLTKMVDPSEMVAMGYGRMGFYTVEGFVRETPVSEKEAEALHKQESLADWS